MQQQMNQPEQCGSQQQMQQSMMLCPVQYVYEAPVILPQPQENQTQQNQILINVKNPPPWIQNRTQNQIVYVQQVPNNYQPYIHQQMIQNPVYHPQMGYQIQQIQPMITQDNRQYIQIPNLNQYNMVQHPTTQMVTEDSEKMPLLTQMLNQKANANVANNTITANVNNVRPIMTPTANMIRPITQNQQVQTDKVSPSIKGRPRNVQPQIITINPMQQRQITHQKPETVMNVRPTNIRNEVPQHIRTKIPSSISVKTINRPMLPRTFVRPFDVMTKPQNFYYNPIVMPVPENKNIITNTDQFIKPNNVREQTANQLNNPRTTMPMQYTAPISNVDHLINMGTAKVSGSNDNHKPVINMNATVNNINSMQAQNTSNKKPILETNIVKNTESESQTLEKLVRNTVFVQARGRVLNDKEIIEAQGIKRTIDERLQEDSKQKQEEMKEAKSTEETIQISKKIKVEVSEDITESNKILSSPRANMNIQTQQSRINNLQMNEDNAQKDILDQSKTNKDSKVILSCNMQKSEEPKTSITTKKEQIYPKTSTHKENNDLTDKKPLNKLSDKVISKSAVKEETNVEKTKKKEGKITVLTHVLEGYIIQESNVAFPIQKPTMEKEIKKEGNGPRNTSKEETTSRPVKQEDGVESKGHISWKSLNRSIESEKEMEFAVTNKDDPFANVKRSTVESWTAEQLASHLEKYKWTETASKLLDEEIDGESILLVNKDQLVAVGVSEEHAERIVAFSAS